MDELKTVIIVISTQKQLKLLPQSKMKLPLRDLNIKPVPAGHTPGATGFYIEFEHNDEKETILITGDFTRRSVAGYSGPH